MGQDFLDILYLNLSACQMMKIIKYKATTYHKIDIDNPRYNANFTHYLSWSHYTVPSCQFHHLLCTTFTESLLFTITNMYR